MKTDENMLAWLPKKDAEAITKDCASCLKYIRGCFDNIKTDVMKAAAAIAYATVHYKGFSEKLIALNPRLSKQFVDGFVALGNGASYSAFLFAYAHSFADSVKGVVKLDARVQKRLEEGVSVVDYTSGVIRRMTLSNMSVRDYKVVVNKVTGSIRTVAEQRKIIAERRKRSGEIVFDPVEGVIKAAVGAVSCMVPDTQAMQAVADMLVKNHSVNQFLDMLNDTLKLSDSSIRCVAK